MHACVERHVRGNAWVRTGGRDLIWVLSGGSQTGGRVPSEGGALAGTPLAAMRAVVVGAAAVAAAVQGGFGEGARGVAGEVVARPPPPPPVQQQRDRRDRYDQHQHRRKHTCSHPHTDQSVTHKPAQARGGAWQRSTDAHRTWPLGCSRHTSGCEGLAAEGPRPCTHHLRQAGNSGGPGDGVW